MRAVLLGRRDAVCVDVLHDFLGTNQLSRGEFAKFLQARRTSPAQAPAKLRALGALGAVGLTCST
jgi:hypothetical protein